MKVVRAGILGFCMGVRRAVDMACQAVEDPAAGRTVYTLGPLIHNPAVLDTLEKHGIRILENHGKLKESEPCTVIIRAHGVPPAVERELVKSGVQILDATCPHVKASQLKASELSGEGFHVFLAGEQEHGEIIGIRGYIGKSEESAGGSYSVVADPSEAKSAAAKLARVNPAAKTALIGQTTMSQEEYNAMGAVIKEYFPSLKILNTICEATGERQNALRRLSSQVDAFVIAGGRDSANTRRLLSIAEASGKKAWLVETPDDLPPDIASFKTVGLAAGASTPDSIIDEIEEALLRESNTLY